MNRRIAPVSQVASALVVFSALSGCGGPAPKPGQLPVYRAKGSIVFEGKPLVGAIVNLVPVDSNPVSDAKRQPAPGARTDDKGQFVLSTYNTNDGAPKGEYLVMVSCADRNAPKVAGEFPELLPERYQTADSGLKVTIAEQVNQLQPLELTK